MSRSVFRLILSAGAFAVLMSVGANPSHAQTQTPTDQRLMIVNGNTGHVIYDDRRDDLFCVTRLVIAGYNQYGRPIYRRTMRCR